MRIHRHRLNLVFTLLAPLVRAQAQPAPDLKQVLERLDRLESENRELRDQVRELREQMRAGGSPTQKQNEHADIEESRTAELAQVKVEASQRFPIRLTGMALVNAFSNSKLNGGSDNPTLASTALGGAGGGVTWRQTIIGLDYRGPQTVWNGKIHGSVFMDFFGGTNQPLNNMLRIRTADFTIDWQSRSLTIAQDKALIAQREPSSLAQVGLAPLTGAGNLWIWEPQVRFEQRIRIGEQSGLNARIGVVQTSETSAGVPAAFANTLDRYRPGLEGRFELYTQVGDNVRFEVAPGFHASSTHVAGGSAPSRVASLDWLVRPVRPVEFTGFLYTGKNIAHFGTGGIRQGFWIAAPGNIQPVDSRGGWAQLKLIATNRLSFHVMAGLQDDRNSDVRAWLAAGGPGPGIGKNQAYGANFFYKLAPNVIMSFETMRTRTSYLTFGKRLLNHYDLAFAYLF